MSWPKINHRQAVELTRFICQLRPDWDRHGVEHHLGKARDMASAPDLAIAAIKAATNAHNRTPAVIALPGEHWRTTTVETAPRHVVPAGERCTTCGQDRERCRRLSALPDDGHAYAPAGAQVDQATGEIRTPEASSRTKQLREAITITAKEVSR